MSAAALAKKLCIRPGMRLLILHPPAGYLASLEPLPEAAKTVGLDKGPVPFMQAFFTAAADFRKSASRLLA
jgi:hypothetical protein